MNVPINITFQAEKTAEEIEEIAFDQIDILAAAVADQTAFVGEQLRDGDFSRSQIMKLGDGLKTLGLLGAGLLAVSDSLRTAANFRRADNLKLKLIPSNVNAEAAERRSLIEKFTIEETPNGTVSDSITAEDSAGNQTLLNLKNTDTRILARKISHIISHEDIESELQFKLQDKFEEWANDVGVYITAPEVIETTFSMIMFYMGNRKSGQADAILKFVDSIINDLSKEHRDELKQFETRTESEIFSENIRTFIFISV